ncbi:hypothetical protein VNO78_24917 [Psophocarpus tetragonolobus]|uniref:Uncharacterized protein n=1 Tax=Psophocarpus tetragonolobus TaxID=3891 RepID=A0AAN9S6F2_PSOTE
MDTEDGIGGQNRKIVDEQSANGWPGTRSRRAGAKAGADRIHAKWEVRPEEERQEGRGQTREVPEMENWSENGEAGWKREFHVDLEDRAADRVYCAADLVYSERRSDRWTDSVSPPSVDNPANQKATRGHNAQGQCQWTEQHVNRGKYANIVGPAVLCQCNGQWAMDHIIAVVQYRDHCHFIAQSSPSA